MNRRIDSLVLPAGLPRQHAVQVIAVQQLHIRVAACRHAHDGAHFVIFIFGCQAAARGQGSPTERVIFVAGDAAVKSRYRGHAAKDIVAVADLVSVGINERRAAAPVIVFIADLFAVRV